MNPKMASLSQSSTADQRQRSGLRDRSSSIEWFLAVLVSASYVTRATVLKSWFEDDVLTRILDGMCYVALAISCVTLALRCKYHLNVSGVVLASFLGLSAVASDSPFDSIMRFLAWLMLLVCAGPVLRGSRSKSFRLKLASLLKWMLSTLVVTSFVWLVIGLPNLGRGAFSGAMNHSMVLGPTCAIAAIFSLYQLLFVPRWRIVVLALFCMAVVLCAASASRIALFGLAVAVALLILGRLNSLLIGLPFLGVLALLSVATENLWLPQVDRFLPEESSTRLTSRQIDISSREGLWSARLEEFRLHPLLGSGFGILIITPAAPDQAATYEPGSSYLAVLAMTGLVGVVSFVILFSSATHLVLRGKARLATRDWALGVSLGGFWAIHGLAEGYILAAGSLMCLLFWLSVGRVFDEVSAA